MLHCMHIHRSSRVSLISPVCNWICNNSWHLLSVRIMSPWAALGKMDQSHEICHRTINCLVNDVHRGESIASATTVTDAPLPKMLNLQMSSTHYLGKPLAEWLTVNITVTLTLHCCKAWMQGTVAMRQIYSKRPDSIRMASYRIQQIPEECTCSLTGRRYT